MASIATDKKGCRTIQFVDPETGNRRSLRLGKIPMKTAEAVKVKIEYLVASKLSGLPLDAETARWLGEISDKLADRLAELGLIERQPANPAASDHPPRRHRAVAPSFSQPASKPSNGTDQQIPGFRRGPLARQQRKDRGQALPDAYR